MVLLRWASFGADSKHASRPKYLRKVLHPPALSVMFDKAEGCRVPPEGLLSSCIYVSNITSQYIPCPPTSLLRQIRSKKGYCITRMPWMQWLITVSQVGREEMDMGASLLTALRMHRAAEANWLHLHSSTPTPQPLCLLWHAHVFPCIVLLPLIGCRIYLVLSTLIVANYMKPNLF